MHPASYHIMNIIDRQGSHLTLQACQACLWADTHVRSLPLQRIPTCFREMSQLQEHFAERNSLITLISICQDKGAQIYQTCRCTSQTLSQTASIGACLLSLAAYGRTRRVRETIHPAVYATLVRVCTGCHASGRTMQSPITI